MPSSHSSPAVAPAARVVLWCSVPFALLATWILSFSSQFELACAIGWPRITAWLLPVAVEIYAAASTAVAFGISRELPVERKRAGRNSKAAIAMSVVLNATWHMMTPYPNDILRIIALVVSVLPPIIAARLIHLAMSLPGEVPEPEPISQLAPSFSQDWEQAPVAAPKTEPAVKRPKPAPKPVSLDKKARRSREESIRLVQEWADANDQEPSGKQLAMHYDGTDRTARQWRNVLSYMREATAQEVSA